jgi:hypothetical protein
VLLRVVRNFGNKISSIRGTGQVRVSGLSLNALRKRQQKKYAQKINTVKTCYLK